MKRKLLGLTLALFVLALGSVPAQAHDVYQNVWTWDSDGRCLRDKPLINLENNYFSWVTATPHQENPINNPCTIGDWPWTLSVGYLTVQTQLYDEDGAAYCMKRPQIYNTAKSTKLEQQFHWKVANIKKCLINGNGFGYVGVWGYAQVFYNGAWHPGYPGYWVWSGWHWCCPWAGFGGPRRPAPPVSAPRDPGRVEVSNP